MSEAAPILRVTVGTPIYSQDGGKIGTVKEVRAQSFKVQTGLFQRDYWLPAQAVREAAPDAAVTLSVDKGQIDRVRLDEQQAAQSAIGTCGAAWQQVGTSVRPVTAARSGDRINQRIESKWFRQHSVRESAPLLG